MTEQVLDMEVAKCLEAGAMSLYKTSPPALDVDAHLAWQWLTPAIRNRWRRRFAEALTEYAKYLKVEE